MSTLIFGLVVFFGIHLVPTLPAVKKAITAKLGEKGYRGLHSFFALLGLILIIWGYIIARPDAAILYDPPAWTRHAAMVLMLPVFILMASGRLPGKIKATVKHPLLTAIKLWAFVHLMANGDAASLVLFGAFLVFGVYDRISLKRRGVKTAAVEKFTRNDLLAVGIGLGVYGFLILIGHGLLFGVPLLPR